MRQAHFEGRVLTRERGRANDRRRGSRAQAEGWSLQLCLSTIDVWTRAFSLKECGQAHLGAGVLSGERGRADDRRRGSRPQVAGRSLQLCLSTIDVHD